MRVRISPSAPIFKLYMTTEGLHPDFGPEEGAVVLANQLGVFIERLRAYSGPEITLSPQESEQLVDNYDRLKEILSDQGYEEKLTEVLGEARSLVDRQSLHERFGTGPAPDSTKLDEGVMSFPGLWSDIVSTLVYTEIYFRKQTNKRFRPWA